MGCVECGLESSLSQACEEKLFSRSAGPKGLRDRRETKSDGSEIYYLLWLASGA